MMFVYRALLHFYPSSFRAEYGSEMEAIFSPSERVRRGVGCIGVLVPLGDVTMELSSLRKQHPRIRGLARARLGERVNPLTAVRERSNELERDQRIEVAGDVLPLAVIGIHGLQRGVREDVPDHACGLERELLGG